MHMMEVEGCPRDPDCPHLPLGRPGFCWFLIPGLMVFTGGGGQEEEIVADPILCDTWSAPLLLHGLGTGLWLSELPALPCPGCQKRPATGVCLRW